MQLRLATILALARGVYRDYRDIAGMRVPFEAEVTWQFETGPFTYAHWLIDCMEYDEALPA